VNTKRLKPYFLNTLLTITCCAAYGLIQDIITIPLLLLISVLLGVVFYREHFGLGIANSIVVLTIFTLFFGVVSALVNGVPLILLALALALGVRLKMPLKVLLLLCAGLFMVDLMVSMELLEYFSNGELNISAVMLESGTMVREMMMEQYSDPEMLAMVEEAVRMSVDMAIMLAPGMFIIISTILAYVLIVVYKRVMNRQQVDTSFLIPFEQFGGDRVIAVLYVILFIVLTAAPMGEVFSSAALNVFIVLSFIFAVFGAAVFDYKFKQKGMKKILRRLLIFGALTLSGTFMLIPLFACIVFGLLDSFFDYRHLHTKEEQ